LTQFTKNIWLFYYFFSETRRIYKRIFFFQNFQATF